MTRAPVSAQQISHGAASSQAKLASLRDTMKRTLRAYLDVSHTPAATRQLKLVSSSYGLEELSAALDVLLDDQMTMGVRTAEFEKQWAQYVGAAGAIMVNSGSSANLLALAALSGPNVPGGLKPGDEVIVPAVAWSTSIFPIIQMGCIPVFVDIDADTLNISVAGIERALSRKTRAIMVIHLLGNPCAMDQIVSLARAHHLWLIEDCCEAHGATVNNKMVGTFGDVSTFSFFFSHHMTTIEGGAVCFQDREQWQDRLMSLRAHGWVRGRSDAQQWSDQHPAIDPRWLFVSLGYNVRPTEINAALGLAQIEKLPGFIKSREAIRTQLLAALEGTPWLRFQRSLPDHGHSAFGFAMLIDPKAPFTRGDLQRHLEAAGIQTRPIVGGNFARQPVMQTVSHRIEGELAQADLVHRSGFMISNHHDIVPSQVNYVAQVVREFIQGHAHG